MDSTSPGSPLALTQLQVTVIAVPLRLHDLDLEVGHRANTAWGTTLVTGHPNPGESLDEASRRIVQEWIGCEAQYVEQLYTLSTERTGKRDVAVSYLALFRQGACQAKPDDRLYWSAVVDLDLHDDVHRRVFDYALVRLKAKLGYTNIAFHLLPPTFTLSELQQVYEHVLGHQVDKRNFRRRMAATGTLVKTSGMRRDGSHRPAALYTFASQDDHAAYLTPSWAAASLSARSASEDN
jgi:8-oxo-dGTP diphosphatase